MALYRPDESFSVRDYLISKFGTDDCEPGQEPIWRLALTKQIHDSYTFFATNFCFVTDKSGEATLLKPWVGQAIHRYTIDCQIKAGLPARMVEVKARQLGWTTENIARLLHYCLDENRRGLLLVNDEDVAAEQATRLFTMLNGLPQWMHPMRRIQNLKHLVFDNPNPKDRSAHPGLNSAVQVTVPSSFRGVGGAIFVCISEFAFMDDNRQEQVQSGLISAIGLNPKSILVIDTTPNGFDFAYEPMVREAIEDNPKWTSTIENWKGELDAQDVLDGILGTPDSVKRGYPGVFVPAMCPWRLHPEYSCRSKTTPSGVLPPMTKAQRGETESSLGKISKYGGEEEIELRDRYGVCLERLFFRRRMIDQYKFPTEEMKLLVFRQEYGNTIDSMFVDSGTAPFDRTCLDALSRQERDPSVVGLFRAENEFVPNHPGMQWHQIRVYAPPQNDEKYTMGVDTNVAYESPDSDATVAQVVRFRDQKVVLTYEARVPSHELIKQLYCIYRWYWNCYYAIETAGMGYDLVRRCIDAGMSNVHYFKRYDAELPEPTKYPGWETNRITRPIMDQMLTEVICHRNPDNGKAEPLVNIPDSKTLREIRGLTRTPTGAFKSSRGKDDHVDALDIALCIAMDPYSGLVRHEKEQKEQKREEFESNFKWMVQGNRSRNRPDLANL